MHALLIVSLFAVAATSCKDTAASAPQEVTPPHAAMVRNTVAELERSIAAGKPSFRGCSQLDEVERLRGAGPALASRLERLCRYEIYVARIDAALAGSCDPDLNVAVSPTGSLEPTTDVTLLAAIRHLQDSPLFDDPARRKLTQLVAACPGLGRLTQGG